MYIYTIIIIIIRCNEYLIPIRVLTLMTKPLFPDSVPKIFFCDNSHNIYIYLSYQEMTDKYQLDST